MELEEIKAQLTWLQDEFPREAVEAAIAQREEITPWLLDVLANARDMTEEILEDKYMAHLFAMFLLAQFRETRAYEPLTNFFTLDVETLDAATGDLMTEDLDRMLASVCGGDLSRIKWLIENEEVNEYARAAASTSLVILIKVGAIAREEVIEYYRYLFHGGLRREYSFVWDNLVADSCNIWPGELMDEIQQAFDDDLIDSRFMGFDHVEKYLAEGLERRMEALQEDPRLSYIDDTVKEMSWWAFRRPAPPPAPVRTPYQPTSRMNQPPVDRLAPDRVAPKPGSNAPCPCGSGKKYKKCCGRQD